jgi:hypothetical protein
MKTKDTMTICPVNYTFFTRIRTNFTVMDKIGRAIGPKAHKLRDKSCLNKKLRFSPDMPPHQCPRESPAGDTGRNLKISTFEAGMYMKTSKTLTKYPKKVGHFRLGFGHLRLIGTLRRTPSTARLPVSSVSASEIVGAT